MQDSEAYRRFEEYLYIQLEGAAGGEPVEITPICDIAVTARLEASVWPRADIIKTTKPGKAPLGPVVADEATARAELASAGAEAERHPMLSGKVKKELEAGEGVSFTDIQGAWRAPPLPQTRSVVRKCASCDGAGSFVCDACEGRGDRLCERCDGAGEVDQVCPVCRGSARRRAGAVRRFWDESMLAFRLRRETEEANPNCEACGGAGAVRTVCTACDGAERTECALCKGVGRVDCADCEGSGAQTDRYNPTLLFQYSLFTGAEPQLTKVQLEKLRRGIEKLARLGLIKPRFFDFRSDAIGYRAAYLAEAHLVGARVAIGRRSPRVLAEIYAIGDAPTLIDPPPLIDMLHQRALDHLRLSGIDGLRRLADVMSERDLGRAALRAAARRDFNLDVAEYAPLATAGYGKRLFELAKTCHRYVGWKARRWFWPAAAAAAPLTIAAIDATGLPSAIAGWTSVAAASSGVDGAAAQTTAAESGALAARGVSIMIWWALALALSAALYRYSVRRVLGVARRASRWDALRAGPAPLLGLASGVALIWLLVAPPTPDPTLLARAGEVADNVTALRTEAEERAAFDESIGPEGWRAYRDIEGVITAQAPARGPTTATLSVTCDDGRALLRFEEEAPYLQRSGRISVGLSTNQRGFGVRTARIVSPGIVEWRADSTVLTALRSGAWVRVELLDGAQRWPIREFDLAGSAAAIAVATRSCPF